jgi:hypothetical protein
MKSFRTLTFVSALLTLAALPVTLGVVLPSGAAAAANSVITGELVDEGGSQFRIVGHGHYTAPSGTPLRALDGKTVQVELASGKVVSITESPVPVNPVAHGLSTVRGELRVADPALRTFTFASDTQVYTAPTSIDLGAYNGKMVEVNLDEKGQVTEFKLLGPATQGAYGVPPVYGAPAATGSCMYQGQTYSAGSAVCQSGTQYRCDGVRWQSLGSGCQAMSASDAPAQPLREPRSCTVGDATVAPGSSICRSGTTYRCDDGSWINVQTPCR